MFAFIIVFLSLPVSHSADLKTLCLEQIAGLKGLKTEQNFDQYCGEMQVLAGCESEGGMPIYHFDKLSKDKGAKKILTLSLIHGDEEQSGSVSRAWIARLAKIEPRNSWRVIPIANPDGLKKKTRMNSHGVDLNRNFPTEDWIKTALNVWKVKLKSDPRRYPGPEAASEKETRCLMKHLADFKPDLVISVHTPLGVLDFDGPKVSSPGYKPLPWLALGNYPGSLGRFMWKDRKVPVLTIELKGPAGVQKLEHFDLLQDISGTIAIQAHRMLENESKTTD